MSTLAPLSLIHPAATDSSPKASTSFFAENLRPCPPPGSLTTGSSYPLLTASAQRLVITSIDCPVFLTSSINSCTKVEALFVASIVGSAINLLRPCHFSFDILAAFSVALAALAPVSVPLNFLAAFSTAAAAALPALLFIASTAGPYPSLAKLFNFIIVGARIIAEVTGLALI